MAAFSYQDLPSLVDCVLTPDMVMMMSSSSSIASPSSSVYPSPSFPGEQLQQSYYPSGNLSTAMAVAHSTPASSNNGPSSVTAGKQSKRKLKGIGSSSPNSANSKDVRGGRSKRQKKCKEESVEQEKEEDEQGRRNIEEPPKGYIHVRARRGQATDSHSLAERVRREKISERMKLLQALVPGCDKVTGKATMLDEIINYVQSLQTQVEFLSMKLASVSPIFYNFGVDLEALLLEQQGLNNMTPPMPLAQAEQCSPTSGFAGGPMFESPAVLQQGQQREQANPPCLQGSIGSLYWEVEEESINQLGFCNDNNNVMYC